jgi:transposase
LPPMRAAATAPVFIDFCRRLLRDAFGPVLLVLDGHPVHRSKAVKAFAASTNGRLRLCFLPGYTPELNPGEWVWKHLKHDRIGRAGVTGPDDLKAKALAALHRLQQLPHLVRNFFRVPTCVTAPPEQSTYLHSLGKCRSLGRRRCCWRRTKLRKPDAVPVRRKVDKAERSSSRYSSATRSV